MLKTFQPERGDAKLKVAPLDSTPWPASPPMVMLKSVNAIASADCHARREPLL